MNFQILQGSVVTLLVQHYRGILMDKKVKRSPYSIAERRVPELIPVLGSQLAGGVTRR